MIHFDPYDPETFARLVKAVKRNYDSLKPFRRVRKLTTEAARGHYYNCSDDNPTVTREPVNLMDQLVQVLVRSFVQTTPRARVTNRNDPRIASIFQEHLNRVAVEIDLVTTLRRAVREAILGFMGVTYTSIAPSERDPVGEPFVDSIGLPDFVIDMGRDEFAKADFVGHRLSMRIDEMKNSPEFDPEVVEKLKASRRGENELDDRKSRRNEDGSLFDWADIWVVKVQPANITVYFTLDAQKPLRVASSDSADFGPYSFLAFDRIEDEMMPNSRGAMMLDVHDFTNGQYRRIFMKEDQAAEFHTFEGGSEEDARRIRDAQDGEMIRVENNNGVVRRTKGGTNPQSLATAIHGRRLFDELSGNLRILGGVGPVAETATQEKIAVSNTSRLIRDMQLQVIGFTKSIFQNIAWYEWTNPMRERKFDVKLGTRGDATEVLWGPKERDGDFVQFEIDIVPDSMEHRSSSQQLAKLVQAVQGIIMPLSQMPTDKPVVLDGPKFVQKYSELDNLPELQEVADYPVDNAFVTQNSNGQTRVPAGATPDGQQAGGARTSSDPDDKLVESVLSGAASAPQGEAA